MTELDIAAGPRRLEQEWIGPGPAAAPTLIFLHDGLGCLATWRDVPAVLAAATGCGALVYSRAGYGGSPPRRGPRSDRFMHEEALSVLPDLLAERGVREAILVGHSDGASIALIAAGAAAARPPVHLRGLVLEAPHTFVEPVCVASIERLRDTYRESGLARRMARFHGTQAETCFADWVDVWLRPSFRHWNIEEFLGGITSPLLVVQGEEDEFGTLAQVQAIEARAAGLTTTFVLPGCGHTPHHQRRQAALSAIEDFVARLL